MSRYMCVYIHTIIYTACPCGYPEERQELRDAQHQQGATRHSAMYSNNRLLRVLFPFAGILRQYTQILIRETAVRSATARRSTLAAKPLPQHQHVDRGSRQPQSASQLAASGIRHSRGAPSSSPSLRVSIYRESKCNNMRGLFDSFSSGNQRQFSGRARERRVRGRSSPCLGGTYTPTGSRCFVRLRSDSLGASFGASFGVSLCASFAIFERECYELMN